MDVALIWLDGEGRVIRRCRDIHHEMWKDKENRVCINPSSEPCGTMLVSEARGDRFMVTFWPPDGLQCSSSLMMTEVENFEGRIPTLVKRKVSFEDRDRDCKESYENLEMQSPSLHFQTLECPINSKLFCRDRRVCRDLAIEDPNVSLLYVYWEAPGESSRFSAQRNITVQSGSGNNFTITWNTVGRKDTLSHGNELSQSYTSEALKFPRNLRPCNLSPVTKDRISTPDPVVHLNKKEAYDCQNPMALPQVRTDDRSGVTQSNEMFRIFDENFETEDDKDQKTTKEQTSWTKRRSRHLHQASQTINQPACRSSQYQDSDAAPRNSINQLCGRRAAGYTCGRWWMASIWRVVWPLLLLLPTVVLADVEVRPSLAAPLQNLTVAAGRKAKLTCVVENLADYKVAWMHYGLTGRAVLTVGTVVITKNQRVSLLKERGGASWSLVIKNVTTSDQGLYLCQVNTVPPPEKLYFHISVVVPPRIIRPPQDVVVGEGEDTTLECEATGDPQPSLTWRREDGRHFSLNHSHVVEAAGPRLRLASVSRESSGAFLCVASNGVPPTVSVRVQVSVKFGPEMGDGTGVVWAEAGDRAVLMCGYRGWPEPSVTWSKDSATIEGSLEEWEGRGSGTSKLVLTSVGQENFGHYRCTVTNPLGSVSTMMTLAELTTTTTTTTTTSTTTTTTAGPPATNNSLHYAGSQADGQVLWKTEGSLLAGSSSPASSWQQAASTSGAAARDLPVLDWLPLRLLASCLLLLLH